MKARWQSACVIAVHTLLLFALLNLVTAAALKVRWWLPAKQRPLGPVTARIGFERLAAAYPEMSREDLAAFLAERAALNQWEYEPFTDYRQRAVRGRFLNVSEAGYRLVKDQGPWPPRADAFNVFFFGGSTAFGDGLPDDQTLPSALQQLLHTPDGRPARVYNFARPGYYSPQERILFEQLLLLGLRPDAAVFLDGLNEGFRPVESPERPRWSSGISERLGPLVDEADGRAPMSSLRSLLRSLPIGRVVTKLLARSRPGPPLPIPGQAGINERWLANRRMTEAVARRFGVAALFVWQPIAVYRYDLKYHLPGGSGLERIAPFGERYRMAEADRQARPREWQGVLWLAGAQEGRHENLYVDEVHYTARFARELAASIAAELQGRR